MKVTRLVHPLCVCVPKYGVAVHLSVQVTREFNLASYRDLTLLIEALYKPCLCGC